MSTIDLTETVKDTEHVEILLPPVAVKDNGVVVGTVSLVKVDVTDFKTKAPTGEKLVYAEFVPNAGRKSRIRWKHLSAMHEALVAQLSDDDDDAPVPAPEPEPAPPAAKAKGK